jgi:quercetin dioxygenase-like cupin family protein
MQSWNLTAEHPKDTNRPRQLLSTSGLRVDMVDLARDEQIADYWGRDRVVIQVLGGSVSFTAGDYTALCEVGTLLAPEPGETHSLRALEQSRLLVTFTPRPRGHSPGGG